MVLITGANGFLGYYLTDLLLKKGFTVLATGKGVCRLPFENNSTFIYAQMDITDPFAVHDIFEKYTPAIVIHTGAMSKPDECETNQWECYVTNVEATLTLLANADWQKSFFLFISTDFVFDGERGMYAETDLPNPVNFYGKSKTDAEDAVKEYANDWAIIRTCLVYGKPATGKQNILTVVREKLEKGETYQVFDDQFRTPTYVEDLVHGIVSIIEKKVKGIYHLAGTDFLTPYQMAIKTADYLQLDKSCIVKTTAAGFIQPAKRPPKTGLLIDKAIRELKFDPLSFEEGMRKTFDS
jgi:dTDP-4-dehydrorhamnose reductase